MCLSRYIYLTLLPNLAKAKVRIQGVHMWWPITLAEAKGRGCKKCGNRDGLSRDEDDNIYCPDHRHLHKA